MEWLIVSAISLCHNRAPKMIHEMDGQGVDALRRNRASPWGDLGPSLLCLLGLGLPSEWWRQWRRKVSWLSSDSRSGLILFKDQWRSAISLLTNCVAIAATNRRSIAMLHWAVLHDYRSPSQDPLLSLNAWLLGRKIAIPFSISGEEFYWCMEWCCGHGYLGLKPNRFKSARIDLEEGQP